MLPLFTLLSPSIYAVYARHCSPHQNTVELFIYIIDERGGRAGDRGWMLGRN